MEINFDDIQSADVLDDDVIELIGTYGYFSDKNSENVSDWSDKHQLKNIVIDTDGMHFVTDTDLKYQNFLPADKVKQADKVSKPKKKWRPFKCSEEFIKSVGKNLGDIITIKCKDNLTEIANDVLITEFDNEFLIVGLGTSTYCYWQLFKAYEWRDSSGNWQPFGVLEDVGELKNDNCKVRKKRIRSNT